MSTDGVETGVQRHETIRRRVSLPGQRPLVSPEKGPHKQIPFG